MLSSHTYDDVWCRDGEEACSVSLFTPGKMTGRFPSHSTEQSNKDMFAKSHPIKTVWFCSVARVFRLYMTFWIAAQMIHFVLQRFVLILTWQKVMLGARRLLWPWGENCFVELSSKFQSGWRYIPLIQCRPSMQLYSLYLSSVHSNHQLSQWAVLHKCLTLQIGFHLADFWRQGSLLAMDIKGGVKHWALTVRHRSVDFSQVFATGGTHCSQEHWQLCQRCFACWLSIL